MPRRSCGKIFLCVTLFCFACQGGSTESGPALDVPSPASTAEPDGENDQDENNAPVSQRPTWAIPLPDAAERLFPADERRVSEPLDGFLALDPAIAKFVTVSSRSIEKRQRETVTLEAKLRKISKGPQEEQDALLLRLLALAKVQAASFERAAALSTKLEKFPDPHHFIRASHGKVITICKRLLKKSKMKDRKEAWEADRIIAQLRTGIAEAVPQAQQQISKGGAESVRLKVALAARTLRGGAAVPGATWADLQKLTLDPTTTALVNFYRAEELMKSGSRAEAKPILTQCLRGNPLPKEALTPRCGFRLTQMALGGNSKILDGALLEDLIRAGAVDQARGYMETVALANLRENLEATRKIYSQIAALPGTPPIDAVRIQAHALGLTLKSGESTQFLGAWQYFSGATKPLSLEITGLDPYWERTHAAFERLIASGARGTALADYQKTHEFIRADYAETYGKQVKWELRWIQNLSRAGAFNQAVAAAVELKSRSLTPEEKIKINRIIFDAFRLSAGLPAVIDWKKERAFSGSRQFIKEFIQAAKDLSQNPSLNAERNWILSQAVFAAGLAGDVDLATDLLILANKGTGVNTLGEAASFLLFEAASTNNHATLELVLRKLVAAKIAGAAPQHADLPRLLEATMAKRVSKDLSAAKNASDCKSAKEYRTEFPQSASSPEILLAGAQCYKRFGQLKEAADDLENLLTQYPSHPLAKAARLEAKEVALSLGQPAKAARHLVEYGRRYIDDGMAASVWTQAATLYVKENRPDMALEALKEGERLAATPTKRIELLAAMARFLQNQKRTQEAAEAFGRMRAVAPLLKGDDVMECLSWSDLQMAQLHIDSGRSAEARPLLQRVAAQRPTTERGLRLVAKANHLLGRALALDLSANQPTADWRGLSDGYSTVKRHLLIVCEIPNSPWCAAAYRDITELAALLLKKTGEPEQLEATAEKSADLTQLAALLSKDRTTYEKQAQDALTIPLEGDDPEANLSSFVPKNP